MKTSLNSLLLLAAVGAAPVFADDNNGAKQYKVTVTNLTKSVLFTPLFAATHKTGVRLFTLGEPASDALARVAEGGDTGDLTTEWNSNRKVFMTMTHSALPAGESTTFYINAKGRFDRLSMTSMLLPTNDTLLAVRGVKLPKWGSKTYRFRAYDGGSETNDELCENIPGPQCSGSDFSPEDSGEGYVYPSPGIHGEADLKRAAYNWQGAVGKVKITRMK